LETDIGKSIDFDVVRESWQKYELNDNTIIKTKFILTRLHRTMKVDGSPNYTFDSQSITVTLTPSESKGPKDPNPHSPKEYEEHVVQDDVKYNTVSEEWYEYIVDDGTRVRIKTTVTRIRKTDLFDKDGEPVFLVDNNALVQIRLPKK